MTEQLFDKAITLIDAANSEDLNQEIWKGEIWPKELLYSHRMSNMLERYAPDADEVVQLAVRAQHIQRWKSPRSDYPMNRKGYHQWRAALNTFHAETVADLLREVGYDNVFIERVKQIVSKQSLKTNSDTQLLEDVASLVFLEHYIEGFAASHPEYDDKKWNDILSRVWNKLSRQAHQFIRKGQITLPEPMRDRVQKHYLENLN